MSKVFRGVTVGIVAVSFLVIGLIVASNLSLTPQTEARSDSFWTEGTAKAPAGQPGSFADLAEELSPAVVNISTATVVKEGQARHPFGKEEDSPFREFFGDEFLKRFFGERGPQRPFKQRSLGSGFIINEEGYIITNNHVVAEADEVVVILEEGDEYPAEILGTDEKTDLALIKIEPKNGGLPLCRLGDSDKARVGDWVLAIGNPFGLGHTVTAGIVSAKGRELGAGAYDDFIQTDAAINPGNSGGPLFDTAGNVVGINSIIYSRTGGNQGIGFAIPINLAKAIVSQLKEKGEVTRAWLGVLIQQITPDMQEALGLSERKGALVADVVQDGPAAKAGIQRGDVIVRFNGEVVESQHQLPTMVAYLQVGTGVEVVALRDGKEKKFTVTLEEMTDEATPVGSFGEDKEMKGELGLTVQNITPEIAERLDLGTSRGVLVSGVEPGSPAAEAGLARGDVILEVDRQEVSDVAALSSVLEKSKDKASVLFLVNRGGRTIFIAVKR
ncbi:MAG: DegQ family serine endoprotease [bacterium]|nr:DegQ family serine endoprotease [bacterium]MDT8395358.1 DegQ family serine endoprotease [bacterium]